MSPLDTAGQRKVVVNASQIQILVRAQPGSGHAHVELWSGDPAGSDGVAVVVDEHGPVGLYKIPLCECGDRGCGNARLQLEATLAADTIPAFITAIWDLPLTIRRPTPSSVWNVLVDCANPTS